MIGLGSDKNDPNFKQKPKLKHNQETQSVQNHLPAGTQIPPTQKPKEEKQTHKHKKRNKKKNIKKNTRKRNNQINTTSHLSRTICEQAGMQIPP